MRYDSLRRENYSYARILSHLGIRTGSSSCHLDPDLHAHLLHRSPTWRPCFGQHGAAAAHLVNQGVQRGDVFLFFGTFRQTQRSKRGKLSFVTTSPKRHIIFGFLEIDEILDLHQDLDRERAVSFGYEAHPHLTNDYKGMNLLFTSTRAGTFSYHDRQVLTQPGSNKSLWELPLCFSEVSISRHTNPDRLRRHHDKLLLQTVGIGQDFVVSESEATSTWAWELINASLKTWRSI